MPCTKSVFLLTAVLLSAVYGAQIAPRQDCGNGYQVCSPPGATSNAIPDIGTDLSGLYIDILDTVNPHASSDATGVTAPDSSGPSKMTRDSATICCADGTTCLLLLVFAVPICYDPFTTDFFLPDGSFGTVEDGNYTTGSGASANLLSGDYELANGQRGNIYAGTPTVPPNTSTLAIPTPYTSKGVGSAIPASQLGAMSNMTTATMSAMSSSALSLSNVSTMTGYRNATPEASTPASYLTNPGAPPVDLKHTTWAILLVSLAILMTTVAVL